MHSVYCILVLAVVLVSGINGKRDCEGKCPIAYKCSSEENVVWATDGQECFVIRNACQYENTNCQRQNNCQDVLKIETKENCQKLCKDACTLEYRPVCAYYNDSKETFPNECALQRRICSSGETWSLFSNGQCDGSSI